MGRRAWRARPLLVRLGFLGPFFVPFLLFFVVPIVYALYESTLKVVRTGGVFGTTSTQFAGFQQYAAVLGDTSFTSGILRVIVFALIQVPLMTVIAVLLALLIAAIPRRAGNVYRALFFLPYAVPGVIASIMWSTLYQPQTSPLNEIGINLPLLGALVLPSIANIGIWGWAGFNMILMSTALTSIPEELFEAARIDGASNLRIAMSIKLPLIRPTVIMSAIFSVIGTLQLFTEPTILRAASSVITSTFTPNMLAYNNAVSGNYSYAAAVSVTLAAATFVMSFAVLSIARRAGRS
ncbi:sugar ABC transporter permease [Humibacter sp.]|uniref:carbohydrate ABC transporter permease n=1 Tax=Humibacter sp. TaxID=1940291 RepID=UPI002C6CEBA5|nr:sugar ABC transporter permease [Humibacter sp.]HVX07027.1 sugar ABC transporter permease [Humibacter sp.]